MEFLRFGSSIPGAYWGCCAMCIIQNFKVDPKAKASIQLVNGDGGYPLTNSKGFIFAGPTWEDIFWQRLRYGTFGQGDMPNHGFLAILTDWQLKNKPGSDWLKILKKAGFEFIRTVDNSVYSGQSLIESAGQGCTSAHPNYLFGLFRNVGSGAIKNPFAPPTEWTKLPSVVPEAWEHYDFKGEYFNTKVQEAQLPLYKDLPKGQFLSEKELEDQKIPITYAGLRSTKPQQLKSARDAVLTKEQAAKPATTAPFSQLKAAS